MFIVVKFINLFIVGWACTLLCVNLCIFCLGVRLTKVRGWLTLCAGHSPWVGGVTSYTLLRKHKCMYYAVTKGSRCHVRGPRNFHLLYVDDITLFLEQLFRIYSKLNEIISIFYRLAEQFVNKSKSILTFSLINLLV